MMIRTMKRQKTLRTRSSSHPAFIFIILLLLLLPRSVKAEYRIDSLSKTPHGYTGLLTLTKEELPEYGPSIPRLKLEVWKESPHRLHLRISAAQHPRWEIPESILPTPGLEQDDETLSSSARLYSINFSSFSEPFGFHIHRHRKGSQSDAADQTISEDETIFDTLNLPFIFKDQYIEFTTRISQGAHLYGLGESTRSSLELTRGSTYTLWNRDWASAKFETNLYGSHPFYLQVQPTKQGMVASGVFLWNSNGMDFTYSPDGSTLRFQVIGGVIDLYFFFGPTPADVISQYSVVVGKPAMMPYWSLGFHNCRWGYRSVEELEEVVANYTAASLPLEAVWADIDYMDRHRDFTVDPVHFPLDKMTKLVDDLHQSGRKMVLITDPGIAVVSSSTSSESNTSTIEDTYTPYEDGLREEIFIKGMDGSPYIGSVWPGPTVFADFLHPNISAYWETQYRAFYKQLPFDGSWIDMNEVSNFCNGEGETQVCTLGNCPTSDCAGVCCKTIDETNTYDFPLFAIANGFGNLGSRTIPMSALHVNDTLEYNVHNLYGLLQAKTMYQTMLDIRGSTHRPFILSRSTFAGSGRWTAHWTGDNAATWTDLQASVRTLLSFSLFNMPMVGADICGFSGNTTEELCTRWIQLGAFYPFARDHNDDQSSPQELYRWPDTVGASARLVLSVRYALLPYLYTLFYRAHVDGAMVARPLFANFPQDPETYQIDQQFMLGDAMLVTPVLEQGATEVKGYFPEGIWISFLDEEADILESKGQWMTLPTPWNMTNLHVQGGHMIIMQRPGLTTAECRSHPFHLFVPLSSQGRAQGELFLDHGEEVSVQPIAKPSLPRRTMDGDEDQHHYNLLHFEAQAGSSGGWVKSSILHQSYEATPLEKIVVLNQPSLQSPSWISVNDETIAANQWVYEKKRKAIIITGLGLMMDQRFQVEWG